MATATETLQLILAGSDQGASAAIGKVAGSAEKLGQAARPLNSVLGMLAGQLGLLGPVGNVAGNMFLGMASGLSRVTIAGGLAVAGLGALFSAFQNFTEERDKFAAAFASGDIKFFRDEVAKLNESIGDRKPFDLARGNWSDLWKSAKATLFNLDEKLKAYKETLDSLSVKRVAEITAEFERQKTAISALGFEALELGFRKVQAELMKTANEGKISNEELKASLQGLNAVREESIAKMERESRASNRSPEVNTINELVRAEGRLRAAKEAGDTAAAAALQRDVNGLRTKVLLMDQVALKERLKGLQAITDGLNEQSIITAVNQEIERQKLLFDQGAISAFQLGQNLNRLGSIPTLFQEIKKAADDFFKTGINPGNFALQDMVNKITEVEQKARQTYGVSIPASVTQAIDRMKEFVRQIAEGSGVKLDELKTNAATAFQGIGLAAQGTLKDLGFISKETGKITGLTGKWKEQILGIGGTFTNIGTASEDTGDEIAKVPNILAQARDGATGLARSMGEAAVSAGSVLTQLNAIDAKIAAINAQGGVKVVQ